MGQNLTNLNINATYQDLVQISSSNILTDGLGNTIDNLSITASYANEANSATTASFSQTSVSSSHALVSDTSISASHALVADEATFAGTANSASYATTATTASYALTALSASYAPAGATPTLQEVVDAGNTTATSSIHISNTTNTGVIRIGLDTRVYGQETISSGATNQRMELIGGASGSHLRLTGDENLPSSNSINLLGTRVEVSGSTTFKNNVIISSSLKATNLNYPTSDGTAGQAVITNGAGVLSLGTPATASYAVSSSHSNISDFAFTATSSSYATTATLALSSSHANNSDTATTASYALTASYLEGGVPTPTLQQVTTAGNNTTDLIIAAGFSGSYLISAGQLDVGSIGGDTNIQAAGGDLTLNTLVFPATDGTTGQVLTTDGLGTLSFQDAGGDAFPYTGSASISGSLGITGSLVSGDGTNVVGTNGNEVSIGGRNNNVSGNIAVAVGGEYHIVSAFRGGAFGGEQSTITGTNTFALGGYNNTAQGSYGGVIGGTALTSTANSSNVIGGTNNTCNNSNSSIILAGGSNTIAGNNALAGFMLGGEANYFGNNGARNAGFIGGRDNIMRNFWGGSDDVANGFAREIHGGHIFGRQNQIGTNVGNNGANGLPIMIGGYGNIIGGSTANATANPTAYSTIINSSGSLVDNTTASTTTKGGFVIGGYGDRVVDSQYSGIISSPNSNITSYSGSVIIGGSNITAQRDNEVSVPNLTISNYASLNFPDDATASAGGIPLGGVYHTAGTLKVRIV